MLAVVAVVAAVTAARVNQQAGRQAVWYAGKWKAIFQNIN